MPSINSFEKDALIPLINNEPSLKVFSYSPTFLKHNPCQNFLLCIYKKKLQRLFEIFKHLKNNSMVAFL